MMHWTLFSKRLLPETIITLLMTHFVKNGILFTFGIGVGVEISPSRTVEGVDTASSMFLNVLSEP